MVSRADQLQALAKRQGIASIAQVIVEDPETYAKAVTEAEFTDMLMNEAVAYQKTGESIGQAFSKLFSADTPEALLLRQAHQAITKANRPAMPTPALVNKSGTPAYEQLVEKANKLREFDPSLSFSQAFSKVFSNPVNRELANQERRENRPVSTIYPRGSERQ
jgi:hypothetical protein